MLCDEATSALDPETTDSILRLLSDINQRLGLTIVLITHEMHVIRKICHRVAVMEAGRVVEQGDVLEVFQNPQAEITKNFVMQVSDSRESKESIEHILKNYPSGKLVKLIFVGNTTERPIISYLIKEFQLDINILHGNISQTVNGSYGTLIVQLDGDSENVEKALEKLKSMNIKTEVITND